MEGKPEARYSEVPISLTGDRHEQHLHVHAQITAVYVFQEQLARVYPNTTVQYNMISATFVAALIILLVRG